MYFIHTPSSVFEVAMMLNIFYFEILLWYNNVILFSNYKTSQGFYIFYVILFQYLFVIVFSTHYKRITRKYLLSKISKSKLQNKKIKNLNQSKPSNCYNNKALENFGYKILHLSTIIRFMFIEIEDMMGSEGNDNDSRALPPRENFIEFGSSHTTSLCWHLAHSANSNFLCLASIMILVMFGKKGTTIFLRKKKVSVGLEVHIDQSQLSSVWAPHVTKLNTDVENFKDPIRYYWCITNELSKIE